MDTFDLDAYTSRSRALDLSDIDWSEVARHPLPPEAVRTLRYMQDIETHTIVYLRTLLSTRAIDDPEVATFLACWLYEETFHGRALARFLEAAGADIVQRTRSMRPWRERLEVVLTSALARTWPDFCGVHMAWGAINELTTLTGYQRLAAIADHPILSEILRRIIRDESRHFFFYYRQAALRLRRPRAGRVARFLVERFWGPVGTGVQPASETRFLASYLFSGAEGRAAARRVDEHIRQLPGFADIPLLEAWIDRIDRTDRTAARAGRRYAEPAGSALSISSSSALTT
ncbi:MAG TPA: ferritin-like domain-containing protein [Candidatus Binatia bacterium]|jgi:hypothetical protein